MEDIRIHRYEAEPRYLDLGNGSILKFQYRGSSHAANTTGIIESFRSTSKGSFFDLSARSVVARDSSYSCRNHSVGRDPSSGQLVCFYRKADAANHTMGVFLKTSCDGDAWSTESDLTLSLTPGTIPFGKIVETRNGLMAVFYKRDLAEALFSTDGGATWDNRTTIYDATATAPAYNEPFIVAVDEASLVAMARLDSGGRNRFVFYKSSDGGLTWGAGVEAQWDLSAYTYGTPGAMALSGSKIVTAWGQRGGSYSVKCTVTEALAYLADPTRAIDGTETIIDLHPMRHDSGWTNVSDVDYGYPDVIDLGGKVLVGWYEPADDAASLTRTPETIFSPS